MFLDCWEFFIMNKYYICQMLFMLLLKDLVMAFSLYSINLVYYIDFWVFSSCCFPGINPNWSWYIILFTIIEFYLLIFFCRCLCLYSFWSVFFLFAMSVSSFKVILASYIGKCFCLYLMKNVCFGGQGFMVLGSFGAATALVCTPPAQWEECASLHPRSPVTRR